MSEWKQRAPTVLGMLAAGGRALRRYTGLAIVLYVIQLGISVVAAFLMTRVLANAFALRPEFDRGIDGDFASLVTALRQTDGIVGTLMWLGLVAVILYWLVSWAIAGGLITTFIHRPHARRDVAECFGRGAAGCFWPYARLALLSIVIYIPAAAALILALRFGLDGLADQLTMGGVVWRLVAWFGPTAVLFVIAGTAVDYARVDLARHPDLPSRRALLRSLRLIFSRVRPIAHVGFYLLFFAAVSGAYVALTFERPMVGAIGALSLVVIRQVLSLARFGAKIILIGGQVELSQMQLFPPKRR